MLESIAGGVFVIGVCVIFAILLGVRLIWKLATGTLRFVLLGILGVLLLVFCVVSAGLAGL